MAKKYETYNQLEVDGDLQVNCITLDSPDKPELPEYHPPEEEAPPEEPPEVLSLSNLPLL